MRHPLLVLPVLQDPQAFLVSLASHYLLVSFGSHVCSESQILWMKSFVAGSTGVVLVSWLSGDRVSPGVVSARWGAKFHSS